MNAGIFRSSQELSLFFSIFRPRKTRLLIHLGYCYNYVRLSHGEDDLAHCVMKSTSYVAEVKKNGMLDVAPMKQTSSAHVERDLKQDLGIRSRIWVSGLADERDGFAAAA